MPLVFDSFLTLMCLYLLIYNPTVRLSGESGKVDILLTKETAGVHWTELGKGLQGNNSFKLHKDRGMLVGMTAYNYVNKQSSD